MRGIQIDTYVFRFRYPAGIEELYWRASSKNSYPLLQTYIPAVLYFIRQISRKTKSPQFQGLHKQMTGIEPASSAWEADVLPMNYICALFHYTINQ